MAYKIALNGSNHVSEARVRAFEQSLAESVEKPKVERPQPVGRLQVSQAETVRERTPVRDRPQGGPPEATPNTTADGSGRSLAPRVLHPPMDYPRVLESLERGLAQSYGHQSETLRVHHQYLSNEAAYAQLFAQLMEEQGTLFGNGATSPERSEVVLNVLQTLARSVEQFHTHQSETLIVHNQFLSQQATYAQSFVTLLQEHYGAVLHRNGNGNGNGHHPAGGNGHDVAESLLQPRAAPSRTIALQPAVESVVEERAVKSPMVQSGAVAVVAPSPSPIPMGEGEGRGEGEGEDLSASLLTIVSDKTGYPVEMLDLDMDMEADLGIDSIKRVEILGALQDAHPDLPEIETEALAELRTLGQIIAHTMQSGQLSKAPTPASEPQVVSEAERPQPVERPQVNESPVPADDRGAVGGTALRQDLLDIVSDKTGYPVEMLDPDMDMESDLGIDSIKRVEILGALQDQHPDLPEVEADALAELRTLTQILAYMEQETATLQDETARQQTAESKKA